MAMIPRRHGLVSLLALFIILFFPMRSACTEDLLMSQKEVPPAVPDRCRDVVLKRFEDIDYDSFVSLMGRRGAPDPDDRRDSQSWRNPRKCSSSILADLLGQRSASPCPQRRGGLIDHRRCKRFL